MPLDFDTTRFSFWKWCRLRGAGHGWPLALVIDVRFWRGSLRAMEGLSLNVYHYPTSQGYFRSLPMTKCLVTILLHLESLGFFANLTGGHMARSMMLDEMTALTSTVPVEASLENYQQAILEDNTLGKSTYSSRQMSCRQLAELYGLDPSKALFAALRHLCQTEPTSLPLLALEFRIGRDDLADPKPRQPGGRFRSAAVPPRHQIGPRRDPRPCGPRGVCPNVANVASKPASVLILPMTSEHKRRTLIKFRVPTFIFGPNAHADSRWRIYGVHGWSF